jgi:SET domain-containing protein
VEFFRAILNNPSMNRSVRSNNTYVYAAPSPIHGRGLFARADVPAGTDFVEYDGPRLPRKEGIRLAEGGNDYMFRLDRRTDIDGSVAWNLGRHANHGCSPNAKSVKVDGRIWLRALRDIRRGEEITYDYGYELKRDTEIPCRCGQEGCTGKIKKPIPR